MILIVDIDKSISISHYEDSSVRLVDHLL